MSPQLSHTLTLGTNGLQSLASPRCSQGLPKSLETLSQNSHQQDIHVQYLLYTCGRMFLTHRSVGTADM